MHDPEAPFAPDVLTLLAKLKEGDRKQFERLRKKLKKAGVQVPRLDKAIGDLRGNPRGPNTSQVDILMAILAEAELFHTPDNTPYADVIINGNRRTWLIGGTDFRRWLTQRYYQKMSGAPNSESLQTAISTAEAQGQFSGPKRDVYLRTAQFNRRIYLDLADEECRVVEISDRGWRAISSSPVRFRRPSGMQPLPAPRQGGGIADLRQFLNVRTDSDFILIISWMLAALREQTSYPVLALSGEQGSAKSTFSKIVRSLVDPNSAPVRALPREERDMYIAARNGHVLAFDNVSTLSSWLSDALCRLATGGSMAQRQLYSDQDEILFSASRPIILNGIENAIVRSDLADRALCITLEPIPDECRRSESELWKEFEEQRPSILGALLDGLVMGLQELPHTDLTSLPRMADFALWATACEKAYWSAGSFINAYKQNRADAIADVLDADPVAICVREFMAKRPEWSGTASELLTELDNKVDENIKKNKRWPATANMLAGRLRRAATFLRAENIGIEFERAGHRRTRTIHITKRPVLSLDSSSASVLSV